MYVTEKARAGTCGVGVGTAHVYYYKTPLVLSCAWLFGVGAGAGEGGRGINYWCMSDGRDYDARGVQVAHDLPSSKRFPTAVPGATKWLLFRMSSFVPLNVFNSSVMVHPVDVSITFSGEVWRRIDYRPKFFATVFAR